MARRKGKPQYPNTSWGHEAEREDIEAQAGPLRGEREPKEYRRAYATAKEMLAAGNTPEHITVALDVAARPEFTTKGGTVPQWAQVERAVEESMVYVRKRAIADALAGNKPKF